MLTPTIDETGASVTQHPPPSKAMAEFDFNDFLAQLQKISRMTSMRSLIDLLPARLGAMLPEDVDPKKELKEIMVILSSMTCREREEPALITADRYMRIAAGAGINVSEVEKLLRQYSDFVRLASNRSMLPLKVSIGNSREWDLWELN